MSSGFNKEIIQPNDYSGILFPSWVNLNFKKYKLPKIDTKKTCSKNDKTSALRFRKYQEFISAYMGMGNVFRSILIYHGMGTGKTCTAINIINTLSSKYTLWNIIIFIPNFKR